MNNHEDSPRTSPVVTSRPRTSLTADNASWYRVFGIAGNIGWLIAVPAVLFVLGGAWLDKYLGTSPTFVLIGIPLSLVVSAMSVRSVIKQLQGAK